MTEELKKSIEREEKRTEAAVSAIPLEAEPPKTDGLTIEEPLTGVKLKELKGKKKPTEKPAAPPSLLRCVVDRKAFHNELALAAGACQKKATVPILANVILTADNGRLGIKATDLELAIATATPAKVKTNGSIAAPTHRLLAILASITEEEVSLTEEDNHYLRIKAGRSNFKLVSLDASTFPEIPKTPAPLVSIPAEQLTALVGSTSFAVSNEESRYTLNASLLELSKTGAQMVATDGHRLAVHQVNGFSAEDSKILIPKGALRPVSDICAGLEEGSTVDVAKSDSHLFFTAGDRCVIVRQLSGQFPNYQVIIPKGQPIHFEVDREELITALRRVGLCADERSNAMRFELKPGLLHIEASSGDTGNGDEDVSIEHTGREITIGFNFKYLLDWLTTITTTEAEKVRGHLTDEQSSAKFDTEDGAGFYVVMPMRI